MSINTACPDAGAWRAWLDGEVAGRTAAAGHLEACPQCDALVAELRHNAALSARLVAALGPTAAQSRWLPATPPRPPRAPAAAPRSPGVGPRRWGAPLAAVAAGLLLAVLLSTPGGRDVSARFLAQFRSQRLVVVPVAAGARQGKPLDQLERLGTIQGKDALAERSRGKEVPSVAEAARRVGFPVKQPDPATLPNGLAAPRVTVSPPGDFRFTFSRAKTEAHLRDNGRAGLPVPPKLDGATLVVAAPPAVILAYRGADGAPALAVAQAGEITAGVEGDVSLEELRDFLLQVPGLPADTARQLRGIQDRRATLPLFLPTDQVRWQDTTVAGNPAILVREAQSGMGTGVAWLRDGRVYAVGGVGRTADEVLRVANGLR